MLKWRIIKNNNLNLINNKSTITSKIHTFNNLHNFQNNIAKWKDPRLELVEIPRGLIEVLQNAGLTIEKIVDSEPSDIAEELGIDSYLGEIIHKETSKTISKINPPDLLLINWLIKNIFNYSKKGLCLTIIYFFIMFFIDWNCLSV